MCKMLSAPICTDKISTFDQGMFFLSYFRSWIAETAAVYLLFANSSLITFMRFALKSSLYGMCCLAFSFHIKGPFRSLYIHPLLFTWPPTYTALDTVMPQDSDQRLSGRTSGHIQFFHCLSPFRQVNWHSLLPDYFLQQHPGQSRQVTAIHLLVGMLQSSFLVTI